MNRLNHRPRKHSNLKHLIRYFLLAYCKKPHKHQDCTSELNSGLFIACENKCLRKGMEALYLTATLSGEPFYKKSGFSEIERFKQGLSNGEAFELVKMEKQMQNLTAGVRL